MINFVAPINNLGYGVHSYNLISAYSKINPDVCLIPPFGQVQVKGNDINSWLANRKHFSPNDPSIMIFHDTFLSQFSGKPRIGFPVFETEAFSDIQLAMLRSCDYLLTTSEWGQRVLNKHGLESHVIPEGYDPAVFYPDYSTEYKLDRIKKKGVTFVHVGKFEERKRTLEIIHSLDRASEETNRDITVLMKINNPFYPKWKEDIRSALIHLKYWQEEHGLFTKKKIQFQFYGDMPINELVKLYKLADYGIWLSKAEGWNLPLMECIACGTPCITTCNTGMTEYLGDYPQDFIVTANIESVVLKLIDMINNPSKYLALESTCTDSIKEFTWDNAAQKLDEFLRRGL